MEESSGGQRVCSRDFRAGFDPCAQMARQCSEGKVRGFPEAGKLLYSTYQWGFHAEESGCFLEPGSCSIALDIFGGCAEEAIAF